MEEDDQWSLTMTNNDDGGDGGDKIDLEWCETFGKFHALRMTNNNDGVDGDGRHL